MDGAGEAEAAAGSVGALRWRNSQKRNEDRSMPVLILLLVRTWPELRRFRLVAQALHFVMCAFHAGGLPAHDLSDIFRQIASHRLFVSFFSSVFARLHRFQNRLVTAAEADFGVDPGAAQRSADGTGNFLVRLAQLNELGFEFAGEARPLQALLVEIRLQVVALHVMRGVLVTLLTVFAGFDQVFYHADSTIFVHNSLRNLDAPVGSGFGGIRSREIRNKTNRPLKSIERGQ